MRKFDILAMLTIGLVLTDAPRLSAQPPASQATYHILAEKNVRIPMRDGVTLAADVYRPDAEASGARRSANFPRYARNQNTGLPLGTSAQIKTATQTIFHDARQPSHLLLPISFR